MKIFPLNKNLEKSFSPPVEQAFRWLEDIKTPKDKKLLNLSQAAPMYPPPKEICEAIAYAALNKNEAPIHINIGVKNPIAVTSAIVITVIE